MTSDLSEKLRHFIINNIESISSMELLIYFYRMKGAPVYPNEASFQLRSNSVTTEKQIHHLINKGLLARCEDDSGCYYYLKDYDNDRLMEELIEQFAIRPVSIIQFLYERPNMTIKAFGDAFKLKGNKE